MQQSLPSRLLGHYEYEIKLPIPKSNIKKKSTQIIQANLNTTIQEMIDEVCKRQDYEVEKYELCFEGKRLEPSVTLRHSGLPTHGVLDFISKADIPKEAVVNVGLQLASGKRLTNKFSVEETLWSILEFWESQGEKIFKSDDDITEGPLEVPVCNFLRQTVVGKEQLQEKTLRSLDLIRGSGIIRFFYRAEDQLGKQANVSAPLPRPSNQKVVEENGPSTQIQQPTQTNNSWKSTLGEPSGNRVGSSSPNIEVPEVPVREEVFMEIPRSDPVTLQPAVNTAEPLVKINSDGNGAASVSQVVNGMSNGADPAEEEKMDCSEKVLQFATPGQLFVLGENNAMLYHGDDVESFKGNEEPDDFYDVTSRDVESIYKELKARRVELEEAPLLTSSLRNIDENSTYERNLRDHPHTTVRIRFPDRFVLQGSFPTSDSIASLNDFVRRYLRNPSLQFYLFTAPPKTPIDATKTFLQHNLLGLAIVYFGCDTAGQDKYLQDQFYNQVSDPQEVFKNSSLTNISISSGRQNMQTGSINNSQPIQSSSHGTQPSGSSTANARPGSTSAGTSSSSSARVNRGNISSNGTVPKWFKSSLK